MIQIHVIPTATETKQVLLVEITEKLCRKYCVNASLQPTGTVTFKVGNVRVANGYAIATIIANVSTSTPVCQSCGCTKTQVFTESFDIGFVGTTANNISLTQGSTIIVEPAYTGCCAAHGLKLMSTLMATIS